MFLFKAEFLLVVINTFEGAKAVITHQNFSMQAFKSLQSVFQLVGACPDFMSRVQSHRLMIIDFYFLLTKKIVQLNV